MELLGGAAVGMTSMLIFLVFLFSGSQSYLLSSPQVASVISSVLADLANADRTLGNLASLTVSPVLSAVAQAKADDMAGKGYFAHVSPAGEDPWHWFAAAGYQFEHAGENLAIDFSDSLDVEQAWMNSPTHRDNILNPNYTEVGIATAQGIYQGRPTTFVVQAFGAPDKNASVAKNTEALEETVPEVPTAIATAVAGPGESNAQDEQVLGSAVVVPEHIEPQIESTAGNLPWWGYLVSFPRDSMRYVYYAIGLFILIALAVETRFEIRLHHVRHALAAGGMLFTMSILFLVADYFFFVEPILALGGS